MEKQRFRSEAKVDVIQLKQIPNEIIEKRFIMDSLHGLGLDQLKELVGFKKIDFRDKETWNNSIGIRYLIEELQMLSIENVVKYQIEMNLTPSK